MIKTMDEFYRAYTPTRYAKHNRNVVFEPLFPGMKNWPRVAICPEGPDCAMCIAMMHAEAKPSSCSS